MEIKLQTGILRAEVIAPDIFRIRLDATGEFRENGLNRYGILHHPATPAFREEGETLSTALGSLTVSGDSVITLRDGAGKQLFTGKMSMGKDGYSLETPMQTEEKIYGLGDVTREQVEKRGLRTRMWVSNVASYVPIPYLMSNKGWGMLINTTYKHFLDIGSTKENQLHLWGRKGILDFYLYLGADYGKLLDVHTRLTGRPTMLPMWAFGLTFVCNQENRARDMLDDAMKFRQEDIPCDIIGLEPGWMEKYYDASVEKQWSKERFYIPYWAPNSPDTFLSALGRLGYKLCLWLCCDYDFSVYEEEQLSAKTEEHDDPGFSYREEDDFERDEHFGHTPMRMDKITTDKPWFEHLKKFVDQGASAFKLDGAYQVNEHPDRLYGNGMTDEEMHNLYPVLYNKQMSKGFEEHTGRRAMIYSSGGYTGIQQYSATWAGDTGGGAKSLISMLNHGMSGHSNCSCDMEIHSDAGIHFGFLQPWAQLSNWAYWRSPWLLEPEREEIFRFYTKLRYSLIPYLYTAAHTAYRTGMPMLRAMPLVYPEAPWADGCLSQYMLGEDLLVTAFTDQVQLPAGKWVDYWTDTIYEGEKAFSYIPPAGKGGALFVRLGAVLPLWKPVSHVVKNPDEVELHWYGGEEGGCTIYEDDGVSLAYREGAVAKISVSFQKTKDSLRFTVCTEGSYDGMPENRRYRVVSHDAGCRLPIYVNDVRQEE